MIRIKAIESVPWPCQVGPGDVFTLSIDGREVYSEPCTHLRRLACWALLEIGSSGLAYAVGDENLERDLLAGGATY